MNIKLDYNEIKRMSELCYNSKFNYRKDRSNNKQVSLRKINKAFEDTIYRINKFCINYGAKSDYFDKNHALFNSLHTAHSRVNSYCEKAKKSIRKNRIEYHIVARWLASEGYVAILHGYWEHWATRIQLYEEHLGLGLNKNVIFSNSRTKKEYFNFKLIKINNVNKKFYVETKNGIKINIDGLSMTHSKDRQYCGIYQSLKKDVRKELSIIDKETNQKYDIHSEDFPSLHWQLLYAIKGLSWKGDAYDVDSSIERKYVKIIANMIINWQPSEKIKTLKQAAYCIQNSLKKKFISLNFYDIYSTVEKLVIKHKPIKDLFFSGIGNKLMKIDGDLARNIMFDYQKISPVKSILCIHDEFIVPKQYKDLLIKIMNKNLNKTLSSLRNKYNKNYIFNSTRKYNFTNIKTSISKIHKSINNLNPFPFNHKVSFIIPNKCHFPLFKRKLNSFLNIKQEYKGEVTSLDISYTNKLSTLKSYQPSIEYEKEKFFYAERDLITYPNGRHYSDEVVKICKPNCA